MEVALFCINIHYLCIYMQYCVYLFIFRRVPVPFVCVMSIIYENRLFSACFIVWRCNYTSSYIKVDLCAHTDSKNGIFTRRVYSAYIFDSIPPPPIPQVDDGGCYREKFFIFFVTSFLFGFVLDFIQNICRFNSLQVLSRYSSRLISLYFSRL